MLEEFRKSVGFTKTPMNPGDDGSAFVSFLYFANGDSPAAKQIQNDFDTFHADPAKTVSQNNATFIDWLIVNHWGEATPEEAA